MNCKLSILGAMTLCLSLAANAQLNNPNGLAFDTGGHLWIANAGDNNVLELNPANGSVLNTITQSVSSPTRLFVDPSDNLWVLNTRSKTVTVYDNLGTAGASLTETVTNSAISDPLALAVDAYADVYIGNNSGNSIIAINANNGLVETLTKDNSGFAFTAPGALAIFGRRIYAGFGPSSGENAVISYNVGEFLTKDPLEKAVYTSSVNTGPTGIAFDSAGNVYVSDFYSSTWVKFSPSGSLLLTVSNGVGYPEGIAVDTSGNVYVSNSSLNNITVYNSSGALIRTLD